MSHAVVIGAVFKDLAVAMHTRIMLSTMQSASRIPHPQYQLCQLHSPLNSTRPSSTHHHHHHHDLMTMTPHSDLKTSQGLFSPQPRRRAVHTSVVVRSLMQCTREELTSQAEEGWRDSADIEGGELTSARADEAQAIADLEEKQLTSEGSDKGHSLET